MLCDHAGMTSPRFVLLCCSVAIVGCAPSFEVVDRAPGVRAPVTAACDELDPVRCLLPFPSTAFLVADPASETGVHVEVDVSPLNSRDDIGEYARHANGFSRVTTVLAGFEEQLVDTDLGGPMGGVLRLFVASPDSPRYGEEIAVRIEVDIERANDGTYFSALQGDPLETLDPNTEYVVVITDGIRSTEGMTYEPPHVTRVALGLELPLTQYEADIAGYHAPTRTLLEAQGVDFERVLRVWDFITRTEDDATAPLLSMRDQALAALEAGEVTVVIDSVEHRDEGTSASIVRGHLVGLPNWLDGEGLLERGPDGLPVVLGDAEARFRVVIPRGTGDYRTVLYGHGAGGEVTDISIDAALTENGIAKVNVEFLGWTGASIVQTLTRVAGAVMVGANGAVSPLMQSVSHAIVLRRAIETIVGDALSADTLGGMPNPHVGRRPGLDGTLWVGGSLGGTMGMVIASVDEELHYAVLNVPGAAWSQWVRDSLLFESLIGPIRNRNRGEVNVAVLCALTQTIFDMVDGASFRRLAQESGDIFLAQESMGDPVLPNAGNEFVAISSDAVQVGGVLSPIYGLMSEPTEVMGRSGITQFQVADSGGTFDVHGFAADQHTVAGQAAFEQIELFLSSTWDTGTPIIRVPSLCPAGRCDFSEE